MVARTASEFGGLDLFVSNAAYSDRELMLNANMEGFRRTIDVSMWGRFTASASTQQMVKQGRGGSIVVVSSPSTR